MKRFFILIVLVALFSAYAQAQMVGANVNSTFKTETSSFEHKPIGHYLRLEVGYPNIFTVAYGYQITPWIMVGGGGGFGGVPYYTYDYEHERKIHWAPGFPLFTEFIFSTPKRNVSFFIDYKLGVNVPISEYSSEYGSRVGRKFYSALSVGVGLRNFGIFMGASTNSVEEIRVLSFGLSYNIPLKVH